MAQMIGVTNSQDTYRPTGDSYSLRPTGSLLRFGVGTPMVSVAFGYQVKPWLMVGAGAGYGAVPVSRIQHYYHKPACSYEWINYRNEEDDTFDANDCIPLFLEAEVRTPRYKWSVFLNVRVGYSFPFDEERYRDGRSEYMDYVSELYTLEEYFPFRRFRFSTLAGVNYKNLSLGVGYTNSEDTYMFDMGGVFTFNLSYDLPIATLRRWLMF